MCVVCSQLTAGWLVHQSSNRPSASEAAHVWAKCGAQNRKLGEQEAIILAKSLQLKDLQIS